jgi:hypothetical protein
VDVPDNASNLEIKISGGSGDADLYTRFGSDPSDSAYDCRPYRDGNSETCSNVSPDSGKWHIGIYAYKAFSGVSLTVTYDEVTEQNDDATDDGEITNEKGISDLNASTGEWLHYYINVPSGATNLRFRMSGGSGDADMYIRLGSEPTKSSYDCRPYLEGNDETCSSTSPNSGKWHIGIYAYKAFSGVSLMATHD